VLFALPHLDLLLWAVSVLLTLILLVFILFRRLYRSFPFFTVYLVANLGQTCLQIAIYQTFGIESRIAYESVWLSQAIVVSARALAATEFCHLALGKYLGVWKMASRLFLVSGSLVLALALYFGKDGFRYGVMTLEIGLESFIATIVVGTFLFARYYQVPLDYSARMLGIGLGCYSCLKISNDLVLTKFFAKYDGVWNEAAMIAYVVVLGLWVLAAKAASIAAGPAPAMQTAELYQEVMPEINQGLRELNDHLLTLWKPR
jgi:hypothetical protein